MNAEHTLAEDIVKDWQRDARARRELELDYLYNRKDMREAVREFLERTREES